VDFPLPISPVTRAMAPTTGVGDFEVAIRVKSRIVNIPCNRVQVEVDNRHGSEHQDALLEKWNQGFQMNYRKIYGFVTESAHQEIPFEFIRRDA